MAQAFLERAGGDRHEARSAGPTPTARVNPEVSAAMAETGSTYPAAGRAASGGPTPSGRTWS